MPPVCEMLVLSTGTTWSHGLTDHETSSGARLLAYASAESLHFSAFDFNRKQIVILSNIMYNECLFTLYIFISECALKEY